MNVIKRTHGINGNELTFATFEHQPEGFFVVMDLDCQIEKTYKIGEEAELNIETGIKEVVTSIPQVIKAWESGDVWF